MKLYIEKPTHSAGGKDSSIINGILKKLYVIFIRHQHSVLTADLFPLDRCRRLRADVVNDTINPADFIDDAISNLP